MLHCNACNLSSLYFKCACCTVMGVTYLSFLTSNFYVFRTIVLSTAIISIITAMVVHSSYNVYIHFHVSYVGSVP